MHCLDAEPCRFQADVIGPGVPRMLIFLVEYACAEIAERNEALLCAVASYNCPWVADSYII